jgi:hypothetical protein
MRIEMTQRRVKVAQLLRVFARPDEIARELRVDLATVYRDIQALREQTKRWYFEQAKDGLQVTHRLTIEALEDRIRKALIIESDENVPPETRLKATELIVNIQLSIHNLLPYTEALMQRYADKKLQSPSE